MAAGYFYQKRWIRQVHMGFIIALVSLAGFFVPLFNLSAQAQAKNQAEPRPSETRLQSIEVTPTVTEPPKVIEKTVPKAPKSVKQSVRKTTTSKSVPSSSNASKKLIDPELLLILELGVAALLQLGGILFLMRRGQKLRLELENEKKQGLLIQQRLENQALYDSLTQLPNRRLFWDRLLQTTKIATRHNTRFGVIMADLDKFKPVNDSLGHEAGDLLLREVAKRMQSAIRDSDTLARMGGDEFALICPSMQDRASASVICMRLLNVMKEPINILGQNCHVGLSLGISVFPDHATDGEILIRRADAALYRAKETRNTFVIYDPKADAKQSAV